MGRKLTRRQVLATGLVFGASVGMRASGLAGMQNQTATPESTPEGGAAMDIEVAGAITFIHDPAIIKADDAYYLFCTGNGILVHKSTDLINWEVPFPPIVFANIPDWAKQMIPEAMDIWAPDISFYNGKYHLYYAVSSFGKNTSAIGLATNTTLDFKHEGFNWVDEGLVMKSTPADNFNCIDPNLILDADNTPWLAFGSFWSGIKMRRLDFQTGKLSEADQKLYSLAQRPEPPDAIEAPFIIQKDGLYYLFASFDFCCRGANSTYNVRVGRSKTITGPYVDRDGLEMLNGGGTQVTFPTDRWRGPGHNAILQDNGVEYIVYHAYDAEHGGTPTLQIHPLIWDADGWPSIRALR